MYIQYFKLICLCLIYTSIRAQSPESIINPVNLTHIDSGEGMKAITHVRIIDGRGGKPVEDGLVIIKNEIIDWVGSMDQLEVPAEAEIIDGSGMTLLPGLIDAHFHLNSNRLVLAFLRRGITSLRDPGAWIETYANVRASGEDIPRLYLTGPHFDMYDPAYPANSVIVRDREEADHNVRLFAKQGASAIKVYFRCSLGIIEQICETSHEIGIPVTAHLEITDIYAGVTAGLDGLEHITSLGSSIVPKREAETYKQTILQDNNHRRMGRYEMWASIDTGQAEATALADFLAKEGTYVCPTLGAFEYQMNPDEPDTTKLLGFTQMLAYNKTLYDHGVKLVVGSHSHSPYDKFGGAYHNEMELWAECGIPVNEIIHAATLRNAKFFGIEDILGSVEEGKLADLLLVEGNPIEDISNIRRVSKVMLNGKWIDVEDP